MSKMSFEIEIPQGFYTKEELENQIKNNILKIVNTPINAYSSTGEKITIPFEKLFCDNGEQKELEKRFKEEEKQKEEIKKEEEEKEKEQKIEDDFKKDMELLNELFEEKSRHIKKSLELLKKLMF